MDKVQYLGLTVEGEDSLKSSDRYMRALACIPALTQIRHTPWIVIITITIKMSQGSICHLTASHQPFLYELTLESKKPESCGALACC